MLMAKKKLVLKRQVGDVSPDEYDWRSQFASLDPCDGYVPCDAGKVHGLAVALDESQARCTGLEKALNGVEPHVAGLQARLAEAERDAARYRWLRNTATTSDWCDLGGLTAERTDEEIDKALGAADSADVAHSKAIDSLLDDCATVYGGPFPEGTK
jgi:hypothetical protein